MNANAQEEQVSQGRRNHRVVVTRHGGPEVLQVVEEDLPEPGPGEVRVRVLDAGVSAYDLMQRRSGSLPGVPDVPYTLGEDIAGVVGKLGEGVTSVEAAPGALVGGGSPIVTLLETTHLEFHTTNLSECDLAQIFPGQTAVVTLKAYPDDPIEAAVGRIGLQAGAAVGDAVTFPVVRILIETDLDIRPGMTGRAEIRSKE